MASISPLTPYDLVLLQLKMPGLVDPHIGGLTLSEELMGVGGGVEGKWEEGEGEGTVVDIKMNVKKRKEK